MFTDFCRVDDFENWLRHTQQWMYAVLNRATKFDQLKAMRSMVHRLARLEATGRQGIIERFQLTEPTRELVEMASDLKNIADTLGPEVRREEITEDLSGPIVSLPIPKKRLEELGSDWSWKKFNDDVKELSQKYFDKIKDGATKQWVDENIGWMMMLGLAFFAIQDFRGRR